LEEEIGLLFGHLQNLDNMPLIIIILKKCSSVGKMEPSCHAGNGHYPPSLLLYQGYPILSIVQY
jgi:hypothetical protein